MNIIDGKKIAQEIKDDLKIKIANLGFKPVLAVILANDKEESQIYVRNKVKAGEYVGIEVLVYNFDCNVKEEEIINLIRKLNDDDKVYGIIVQSPVFKHLDEDYITSFIEPKKDVDGFGVSSIGKLALNQESFISATPLGIIKMLEKENITLEGKHVVVVGRSKIVGRPLALAMLNRNATVSIVHSKTKNLKEITSEADILVVAIGVAKFIKRDYVKEGAIVIDVGINRSNEKLVGDVDFDDVKDKCALISPVPGGVGPMTIAMLLNNVYASVILRKEEEKFESRN